MSPLDHNPTRQAGVGPDRDPVAIGYVVVPPDVERAAYVAQCYARNTVTVYTPGGEFFPRVPVPKNWMSEIEFPAEKGETGSPVLLLNMPRHNEPVVGAVFNSPEQVAQVLGEAKFSLLRRSAGGRYVGIQGDGTRGTLTLTVCGQAQDEGRLQIQVINQAGAGQLDVQVRGDATIRAEGTLSASAGKKLVLGVNDKAESEPEMLLEYTRGQGLTYVDEWENQLTITADKIQLRRKKDGRTLELNDSGLSLGSPGTSQEPAVLGEQLVNFLGQLLTAIQAIKVPTSQGPSLPGLLNTLDFEQLRATLKQIQSTVVTVD